jgi:Nucleotidyltransferase
MSELDLRYVAARQILLDALIALNPHLHAVVVVGAHAVYLRTGDAGIAIAPFTTDADLALEPAILAERPELERLLRGAGFERDGNKPGAWVASTTINGEEVPVPVDLMVPDAAAPKGSRRAVDLPGHDRMATRRATGLEAALIDHDLRLIAALDPEDPRTVTVCVAGPTALIISKLHKLHDRIDDERRLADKDAGDVYRLMQTTDTALFVTTITAILGDPLAAESARISLTYLDELFGARVRPGVVMAVRAMEPAVPAVQIEGVCAAFVQAVRTGDL